MQQFVFNLFVVSLSARTPLRLPLRPNITSALLFTSLLFCVSSPQEDSSDLKCQLHFAKEESALMCKKLTKLVKDSEAMKEELAKYRSLYGDVDATLTVEEVRKK